MTKKAVLALSSELLSQALSDAGFIPEGASVQFVQTRMDLSGEHFGEHQLLIEHDSFSPVPAGNAFPILPAVTPKKKPAGKKSSEDTSKEK